MVLVDGNGAGGRGTGTGGSNNKFSTLTISISVLYVFVAAAIGLAIAALVKVVDNERAVTTRQLAEWGRPAEEGEEGGGSKGAGAVKGRRIIEGVLPDLVGAYVGNVTYQAFNATSRAFLEMGSMENYGIVVHRNPNFDRFVAYEHDDDGVPNMGALVLPDYVDEFPYAVLRRGLNSSAEAAAAANVVSWEQWVIKEKGEVIESTYTVNSEEETGGLPAVWIGTFLKQDDGDDKKRRR